MISIKPEIRQLIIAIIRVKIAIITVDYAIKRIIINGWNYLKTLTNLSGCVFIVS